MSYITRVKTEVETNPGLQPLLQFLSQDTPKISQRQPQIKFIEHAKYSKVQRLPPLDHPNLRDIITRINAAAGMIDEGILGCTLIIEDIQPCHVQDLGETFFIDPVFFAGYLGTDYRSVERHPLPLWATTLPSESATQEFCHIHYQRVVKLEQDFNSLENVPLVTSASVPRAVKRLPPLKGVNIALARTCTSVLRKRLNSGFWICLIIVDSTTADIVQQTSDRYHTPTFIAHQTPLHGYVQPRAGFADPSTAQISLQTHGKPPLSYFDRLAASIVRADTFRVGKPSMISLCSDPLRFALQEFLVYSATMHRYVKYYEYSLKDLDLALRGDDINDLQVWRRRAFQTLQKLLAMQNFVEHWSAEEQLLGTLEANAGAWLIKDIQHLITAIEHHSRSLEAIIPVTMAMVQLVDMRRSMDEASHVKQLTYLALVFVPLSFVTGIFSMSESVFPGSSGFWLYFAVAVPLLLLVLGASWLLPLRAYLVKQKQKALK